mmetsp:Transcript_12337/g.18952  ORF Transcript_12337/g.18952 Transcript_12337/m.18952 type:complete len:546 (-) Transcript_12337:106-1743(-)
MDSEYSSSSCDSRHHRRRKRFSNRSRSRSRSRSRRYGNYETRRRRRRSRSWESNGKDDRSRHRKNDNHKHRRSFSSEFNERRDRSVRDDDDIDHSFRRGRCRSRKRRDRRRDESQTNRRRRRKGRRREDRRSRRHRRRSRPQSSSRSSRSPSVSDKFPIPRISPPAPESSGTGVVSDDEPDHGSILPTVKKHSESTSSRDDTVGHFRGGPGTVIGDRYKVVRDVGLGTFGRVVECLDLRRSRRSSSGGRRGENDFVAIKIVRDVRRYYDSAVIEANIVEEVNRRGGRGISHCAILHNAFTWNCHFCMIFESLGPSLYDFLKKHQYQPFPMACIRDFTRQLLETLEFLHSFRLIHTDLKPENILLVNYREIPYKWHGRSYMIPESTKIKIIDFGGATYDDEKKSSVVNTRQYRAPEVILGLGWSMPSDLWSAGCILAELYLGELLLATHDNQEHLALIEKIIGPFPTRMLKRAKNLQLVHEAFDENGKHRLGRVLPPESASYVSKMCPLESIIRLEDRRFLDLLRMLLVIKPTERATAQECVRHRL